MSAILQNIIICLVILVIVGGASYYIYKEKKKGTKCIGCPSGGNCSKKCNCSATSDASSL